MQRSHGLDDSETAGETIRAPRGKMPGAPCRAGRGESTGQPSGQPFRSKSTKLGPGSARHLSTNRVLAGLARWGSWNPICGTTWGLSSRVPWARNGCHGAARRWQRPLSGPDRWLSRAVAGRWSRHGPCDGFPTMLSAPLVSPPADRAPSGAPRPPRRPPAWSGMAHPWREPITHARWAERGQVLRAGGWQGGAGTRQASGRATCTHGTARCGALDARRGGRSRGPNAARATDGSGDVHQRQIAAGWPIPHIRCASAPGRPVPTGTPGDLACLARFRVAAEGPTIVAAGRPATLARRDVPASPAPVAEVACPGEYVAS